MNEISRVASAFANDYMVTLTPDNDGQTYQVSCATLCNTSDYFRAALQGDFSEASDRTLNFEGFDEKTIEGFVYWLSQDRLPEYAQFLRENTDLEEKDFNANLLAWELLLVRLWALGDQYLLPVLQNCSMLQLLKAMGDQPMAPQAVREIFERTAKDSLLRKAATTQITGDLTGTYYKDEEVEELGRIPGLVLAVLDENRKCHGGLRAGCKCAKPCGKVQYREADFMVDGSLEAKAEETEPESFPGPSTEFGHWLP